MTKLMLIDGMAMVYRAYFALNHNPRLNSKGLNTSAILGFATTLYDLLKQQRPTHCAVAFDLPQPTFRHQRYEDYKANREAMPEAIQLSLPYIHQIIEGFSIPILSAPGFEADDVIGTLSHKAESAGIDEILMVTPDKDFAQLVTNKIRLYRFGRMGKPDMIYGPQEVCEKFGVSRPQQVADILGLWGDSIDNIPGIPGIGEKKAKQLVAQFDSVEELVARAYEIKNEKLRNLVVEYKEQALLSKELATIVIDAPVDFQNDALSLSAPDYESLSNLFAELEFRNFARKIYTDLSVSDPELAQRLNLSLKKSSPSTTIKPHPATDNNTNSIQTSLFDTFDNSAANGPDNYVVTATPVSNFHFEEVSLAVLEEIQNRNFSLFLHTNPLNNDVEGIAFAVDEKTAYYLPFLLNDNYSLFYQALKNPNTLKICYNLKDLKHKFIDHGVSIEGRLFDIQLAHYLLDPEVRHLPDFIIASFLNETYEESDPNYPFLMATALFRLYAPMTSKLEEYGMLHLLNDIELPLVDVLVDMENEGVRIDVDALRQYSARLTEERNAIENEIYKYAGRSFNISSPKQLGNVLYEELKITDKPPRTATKQYSTAEDVLSKLSAKHPIVPLILEYRSLSKLISTYLDNFPNLINSETGRLHTIYNHTVTATGRLSSSNPNLQNIPIRTDRGREIRKAFVARDEQHCILAADYSQIELRIIASLSGDEHMKKAFEQHYDIHADTASKIYHIPIDEVSTEQRRNAKSVNFGIIYGISAFGLSEQLSISRKEADALIEEYFQQYPAIKSYIDQNIAFAREHGYAATLMGRRRFLYDINSRNMSQRTFSERNAVNMPIQGTSADMIKIAMIRIFNKMKECHLRSKMILQVHDELVFDCHNDEIETLRQIVEYEMINALSLSIPIEVGVDVGNNWLEAH